MIRGKLELIKMWGIIMDNELKIVTFNLRITVDDGLNVWENRVSHVVHKIKSEAPDLIGFQELTEISLRDLKRQLTDYVFVGCGRDEQMSGEMVIIAYNKNKLDLMSLDIFWFSDTPYKPGSKKEMMILARPCNVAVFKNQLTNQIFRVYNTHYDHMQSSIRVQSSEQLLNDLHLREQNISLPTLIMGDMNSEPQDEEIKAIVNNEIIELNDLTDKLDYTFHDYGKIKIKIDYIFATKSVNASKAVAWADCFDGVYLSDHYPVMVRVTFK